jgi:hypothetical protein
MKLREKIAMIWVFPILTVILIVLFLAVSVFFGIAFILEKTGTLGAIDRILYTVRLNLIGNRLKKLQKEDEKLHTFDLEKMKNNEDSSSNID